MGLKDLRPSWTENMFFFPEENREFLRERLGEIFYRRFKYLIPTCLLMALYFLLIDYFLLREEPGKPAYILYLWGDIAFLAFHCAYILLFLKRARFSSRGNRYLDRKRIFLYTVVALLWSSLTSAVEVRQTGNITTIVIAIMTMATIGLFSLPEFVLLIVLSFAGFMAGLFLLPVGGQPLDYENLIFLFSLALMSFVISRSFFSAAIDDILKTDKLETLNRELHSMQMNLIRKEKLATLGQLAAGIAHEINNPLAYVKGNVSALEQGFGHLMKRCPELTKDGTYGEFFLRLRELFQDTENGFKRISEIIENLKSFSHEIPDDGFGSYDLNRGIENMLVVARRSYAGIARIEKRLAPLPLIEARGSEINQVLLNILLNGLYAIRSAGGKEEGLITICTKNEGGEVLCDLSDSGPGIEEKFRPRIFDPFFTTKPVGEGLGLGLSLSHEIVVSRHRGTLILLEGRPTTFRLSLPIRQRKPGS